MWTDDSDGICSSAIVGIYVVHCSAKSGFDRKSSMMSSLNSAISHCVCFADSLNE